MKLKCQMLLFTLAMLIMSNIAHAGGSYFSDRGTVFYAFPQGGYCGIHDPGHYELLQLSIINTNTLGERNRDGFGENLGMCPLPVGYFFSHGTGYFSSGDMTYCTFRSLDHWSKHMAQTGIPFNYKQPQISREPMSGESTGACPDKAVIAPIQSACVAYVAEKVGEAVIGWVIGKVLEKTTEYIAKDWNDYRANIDASGEPNPEPNGSIGEPGDDDQGDFDDESGDDEEE